MFALGVTVGWNEGCICMWWDPVYGPITDDQVWYVINDYLHRSVISRADYIDFKDMALHGNNG